MLLKYRSLPVAVNATIIWLVLFVSNFVGCVEDCPLTVFQRLLRGSTFASAKTKN
jgi:hypothetical protein